MPHPNVAVLSELTLPDDDGRPRRLGELWARRPVVLTFVRQWG